MATAKPARAMTTGRETVKHTFKTTGRTFTVYTSLNALEMIKARKYAGSTDDMLFGMYMAVLAIAEIDGVHPGYVTDALTMETRIQRLEANELFWLANKIGDMVHVDEADLGNESPPVESPAS